MDDLKQKVKALRRQKGWTQEALAREMCVCVATVRRWEKQGAKPRLGRRRLMRLFQEAGIQ